MKKISFSDELSSNSLILLADTHSISPNGSSTLSSLGGTNSVKTKQIFCKVERYLSKLFFPILVVGFFFASTNIFAEEVGKEKDNNLI
jgi:hypothetical protein